MINLKEVKKGEEYYVLGATWLGNKNKIYEFFIDFHTRRVNKGVKVKFLFLSGTEKILKSYPKVYNKLSEIRILPPGIDQGIQSNLYKNKILMFLWRKDEPVVFSIEDKHMYKTFKSYFDNIWRQSKKFIYSKECLSHLFSNLGLCLLIQFLF